MNVEIKDIDILLGKAVSGNASSEEMDQVKVWLEVSEKNRKIWQESVTAWKNSYTPMLEKDFISDKQKVTTAINEDLGLKVRVLKRTNFIYRIVAFLALPLVLGAGFYFFRTIIPKSIVTAQSFEISSPKGNISKCILPDGSEIWINTGSSIYYNSFTLNDVRREVRLEGEAYFKVAHDTARPFYVVTKYGDLKVTGTAFNVKAYADNNIFETVLEEGSVELMINGRSGNIITLLSGDRISYNKTNGQTVRERVDSKIHTAWRNGEILFRDATLSDLVSELERIYDIRFSIANKDLENYRFRGMFSYNNNLIESLEKIKHTSGIDYFIENKNVTLFKEK